MVLHNLIILRIHMGRQMMDMINICPNFNNGYLLIALIFKVKYFKILICYITKQCLKMPVKPSNFLLGSTTMEIWEAAWSFPVNEAYRSGIPAHFTLRGKNSGPMRLNLDLKNNEPG